MFARRPAAFRGCDVDTKGRPSHASVYAYIQHRRQ